jgi:thioredoxin 1
MVTFSKRHHLTCSKTVRKIKRRNIMGLLKRLIGGGQPEHSGEAGKTPLVEPRHVTGEEFDELIRTSEVPVVVDFWAEWCGPCHMIAPSVATMANEFDGRAVVAKMNADDYPEILGHYGIMGIPTLIYFQGGQEVDRVVGVTTFGILKGKLERLLA